jgi:hypothetical protein
VVQPQVFSIRIRKQKKKTISINANRRNVLKRQYPRTECEISETFIIEEEINLKFKFLKSKIVQWLGPNFYSLTKSQWQRRSVNVLEPRDLIVTEYSPIWESIKDNSKNEVRR